MTSGAARAEWVRPAPRGARGADERLARRVAEGDEAAFAAIYARYHQRLFRYCVSILRDETDAQDALQSTFERAFCALRQGQRNAPLRPWLFRIAHNEAITVIRRREPEPVEMRLAAPCARSAEHEADERDRLAVLVADLSELPARPRSALIMRELEGLSHEDIAIALQTTVGAAKQTIFEARRALAEAAEGREMSCEDIRRQLSDGDRRVLRGRRMRAHLRACRGCTDFAAAIPARRADLRALAPPLAPVAATSILARTLLGHGAGSSWSAATAALGKGGLAGALGSKLALGAAVMATAAAGTAGVAVIEPLVVGHSAGSRTLATPTPTRTRTRAPSPAAGALSRTRGARVSAASLAAAAARAASPARAGLAARVPSSARVLSPLAGLPARGRAVGLTAGAPSSARGVGGGHAAAAASHRTASPLQAPGRLRHTATRQIGANASSGHRRSTPAPRRGSPRPQTSPRANPVVPPAQALGKSRRSTP